MAVAPVPDERRGGHEVFRFEFQHALGTATDLRVEIDGEARAHAVEALVVGELERLERVFTVFDERSDLSRWRRGDLTRPGVELSEVLQQVLVWQERSEGAFNPLEGELSALWRRAEERDRVPDPAELADAATSIADARFEMVHGLPTRTGDCTRLNLNAIAKGYIVDRVCETAVAELGPDTISLNVGGEIRHIGRRALPVGIENPLRPYDNEPPIAVLRLRNAALATSGSARRGFRVAGSWFGHVIDPRTGQPASGPAGVSVVAPDAATADAAATVATVLDPDEAIEWLTSLDDVAGLVIERSGVVSTTPAWTDRFGPVTRE